MVAYLKTYISGQIGKNNIKVWMLNLKHDLKITKFNLKQYLPT